MTGEKKRLPKRSELKVFVASVALAWTAITAASWLWNVNRIRETTLEEARIEARVAFEKDITYRRWNTFHGGVYVRVTDDTPPNPYLEGVPERDVVTTAGTKLTLINPAYMTRQVYEIGAAVSGLKAHLTSALPLRPGNAPDEWERQALEAFERGETEVSSLDTADGGEYMRLMRPLLTEPGCLSCHAEQGYQVGEIRGGLSVAVSMAPLRAIERRNILTLSLAHGLFWLFGLVGHLYGSGKLMRSDRERRQAEEATRRYARQVEESNRMKDLFIDIMRHDLLNPAGIIKCYISYLAEGETDARRLDLCGRIDHVTTKLTEMIENASKYSRLEEMESIECEPLDLAAAVREGVDLALCREGEKCLEVDYLFEDGFPVRANPMVGDIFTNLALNAQKYASEGKRIEVGIEDEGESWRVSVRDFGPGISDEDKEKIFTRFERLAKESVQGTGLGLAIARRLVDLHEGRIWVEDNPVGGCVFCVSLPKSCPSDHS